MLNKQATVLVEKYSESIDQKFTKELEKDILIVTKEPGQTFLHHLVNFFNMRNINLHWLGGIILDFVNHNLKRLYHNRRGHIWPKVPFCEWIAQGQLAEFVAQHIDLLEKANGDCRYSSGWVPFLLWKPFTELTLNNFQEERSKVHMIRNLIYVLTRQSNVPLFFKKLVLRVLAIAHMLNCILKSKWVNHYILGSNKEASYCDHLQFLGGMLYFWAYEKFIHQFYRLEHDGPVSDFKLFDNFIKPINYFDPELASYQSLICHEIITGTISYLSHHHVSECFVRVVVNEIPIELGDKRFFNRFKLVLKEFFIVTIASLSQSFHFNLKWVFWLSPSSSVLVLHLMVSNVA